MTTTDPGGLDRGAMQKGPTLPGVRTTLSPARRGTPERLAPLADMRQVHVPRAVRWADVVPTKVARPPVDEGVSARGPAVTTVVDPVSGPRAADGRTAAVMSVSPPATAAPAVTSATGTGTGAAGPPVPGRRGVIVTTATASAAPGAVTTAAQNAVAIAETVSLPGVDAISVAAGGMAAASAGAATRAPTGVVTDMTGAVTVPPLIAEVTATTAVVTAGIGAAMQERRTVDAPSIEVAKTAVSGPTEMRAVGTEATGASDRTDTARRSVAVVSAVDVTIAASAEDRPVPVRTTAATAGDATSAAGGPVTGTTAVVRGAGRIRGATPAAVGTIGGTGATPAHADATSDVAVTTAATDAIGRSVADRAGGTTAVAVVTSQTAAAGARTEASAQGRMTCRPGGVGRGGSTGARRTLGPIS